MFWWLTSNSIKSKLFVRKKVEMAVANFSEISPKILKVAPKFGLLITKLKALLI